MHPRWDQIVTALLGFAGGLVIWILSMFKDWHRWRAEKRDLQKTESAVIRVAEIGSDATFRNELWKRINDLEAKVETLTRELRTEEAKTVECEHRYADLEDKLQALEAQIKGPIGS